MGWTQPVCQTCWDRENPDREAITIKLPDQEVCCLCGNETADGIYVRKDPSTVPYPATD